MPRKSFVAIVIAVMAACAACGGRDDAKPSVTPVVAPMTTPTKPATATDADCNNDYVPAHAWAGKKPALPTPPELSTKPHRIDDSYTVAGAIHTIHSRYDSAEILKGEVTIIGYVIDTNMSRAPKCAIHKTGKRDPENCVTEIPAFTIADEKGGGGETIRVLGWAKNFASVYEAQLQYQSSGAGKSKPYVDDMWAVELPNPLPGLGAKVKVKGRYGFAFTKATTGMVTDPRNGIVTYSKVEYLEPAKPVVLVP